MVVGQHEGQTVSTKNSFLALNVMKQSESELVSNV